MQLKFIGDIDDLIRGIQLLGSDFVFELSNEGIPVYVEKRKGNIEVEFTNNIGYIKYEKKIHFFRALGLFIESLRKSNSFKIYEEPQFTMNGVMFDVSRNAVMTVKSIKKMILKMAIMGLDTIMLYTEDLYQIDGQPYFGYMRGRYTKDELKECDDFADIFGIEMIPCIQTLAHLREFLKWDAAAHLRENISTLLPGNDATYEFIEEMIKAASAPFRSRRIHLGMDEANELGLGNYLKMHGYQRRFDIMNMHVKRVLEITRKLGLKPMIWSDMYFKIGSKKRVDYDPDAVIPDDVAENIPKDLELVYWDYYHKEEDFYLNLIRKHKKLGKLPIFAGGIWTWVGFGTNYGKTYVNSTSALRACKKEGVKEVFATVWMNNGSINNHFSSLLGLQFFVEHGYSKEPDENKIRERFEFCTGASYNAFMDLKYLDETPGTNPGNLENCNPSKFLLWQDILIGLFDKHVEGLDMEGHYSRLEEKMKMHKCNNKEWDFIFEVPEKLCAVLKLKSGIGLRIKAYYDEKNINGLRSCAQRDLTELITKVEELRLSHRKSWFKTCKPFGWEVADMCYGALLARINTAIDRLMDFVEGRIQIIEELEEERLYFDGRERPSDAGIGYCNSYNRIVTA